MSIETDLRAALIGAGAVTALVAQRIYEEIAPDSTPPPYITFQTITGTRTNSLVDGAGKLRNARIQIDCWALQKNDAGLIADAVVAALKGTSGLQVILNGDSGLPDFDSKLRRVTLDFSIWKRDP